MSPGEKVFETDVLVIGGGNSGARAAIEANEQGADVILVTKGIFGRGGCTLGVSVAAGIGPWVPPGDDMEQHFKDMVIKGKDFLCDQELVRIQAYEGPDRLIELERWGVYWDRDKEGNIGVFPSSEIYYLAAAKDRWITVNRRGTHAAGPFWTGHTILDALKGEIIRRGIDIMQDAIVTKLIVKEGRLTSATALNYLNGDFLLFKTKSAILATGCGAQVYYPHTMVSKENTGDGFALAYHAGAELINMEQFEYISLMFAYPDSARGKAAIETVVESGEMAHLYNALGERFMEKYNKELMESVSEVDLCKAIWKEVKEGRGTEHGGVYLSLKHIPYETLKRAMPDRLRFIEQLGYDPRKDMIEVYPSIHTITGGVRINEKCETNIAGLYAAGQVAFAVGDCLGEGATGITDALVWGKRAGEFAAKYALKGRESKIDRNEVEKEKRRIYRPLKRKDGIWPVHLMREIQKTMWKHVGLMKEEKGMEKALTLLKNIRKKLPRMAAASKTLRYNHELVEALEVQNMLDVAEMITRSSLMRKESRNRFHREDYPATDNLDWLKHIIIKKVNGKMKLAITPVEFPYIKPEGL